jgi:hypothetical protein
MALIKHPWTLPDIALEIEGFRFGRHGQIKCKFPRTILGRMGRFTFVMLFDALIDVFGEANVIALGVAIRNE